MKKIATGISFTFFFALACAPTLAGAQTAQDITAQIQSLLQQIQQIQQVITAQGGTPSMPGSPALSSCVFTRTLSRGDRGDDVANLQLYLIQKGFLGQDSRTGYFGALTEAAVRQWQNASGIVAPGDVSAGWGIFGPRSRTRLSIDCGPVVVQGSSNPFPETVRNCIAAPPPITPSCSTGWKPVKDSNGCTVSYQCSIPLGGFTCPNGSAAQGGMCPTATTTPSALSASPYSGVTPLEVGFSGVMSVSYQYGARIDFGDGTNVQVCPAAIFCDTVTIRHTYASPGTYRASLIGKGSGGDQTLGTATITSSAGAGGGGTTSVFYASPSSGGVPLNVQFTINSAGYFQLDFGDGTAGSNINTVTSQPWVNHTYTGSGTYYAKLYQMQCASSCAQNLVGTATITVGSTGGSSVFSASPLSGVAPLYVNFTGNGGVGCNGGNFTINFGDGTSGNAAIPADACNGSFSTSHIYGAGSYTASLYAQGSSKLLGTVNVTAY